LFYHPLCFNRGRFKYIFEYKRNSQNNIDLKKKERREGSVERDLDKIKIKHTVGSKTPAPLKENICPVLA
jgi:hypothetical protein